MLSRFISFINMLQFKSGAVSTIDTHDVSKTTECLNKECSFFVSLFAPKGQNVYSEKNITFNDLINLTKNGSGTSVSVYDEIKKHAKDLVNDLKTLTDVDEIEKRKKSFKDDIYNNKTSLNGVTFSGTFTIKKSDLINSYNGVIAIDLDEFKSFTEKDEVLKKLIEIPFIHIAQTSASHLGIKAIVFTDNTDIKRHELIFNHINDEVKEITGKDYDKVIKDVSRGQYLAYDPNIYVNDNIIPYKTSDIKEKKKSNSKYKYGNYASDDIGDVFAKIESEKIDITESYDHWLKIGFALATAYGENGRGYFHNVSKAHQDYDVSKCDDQYNKCLNADTPKSDEKTITMGTLIHIIRKYGFNIENKFWSLSISKKGTSVSLHDNKFINFLRDNGFSQVKIHGVIKLVHIENNIIKEVTPDDVKQFVLNYIKKYKFKKARSKKENILLKTATDWKKHHNFLDEDKTKKELNKILKSYNEDELNDEDYELFTKCFNGKIKFKVTSVTEKNDVLDLLIKSTKLFKTDYLNALEFTELDLLKDTLTTCYKVFQNGILEIKKDSVKLIDFKDNSKSIWESDVIQHDFVDDKNFRFSESDNNKFFYWEDFIQKLSNNDFDRKLQIETSLGYLLHKYKDPANPKLIAFTDNKLSSSANGGSGKSLLGKALEIVSTNSKTNTSSYTERDGKAFKKTGVFEFANISSHHSILGIDDVMKNFDFETFYVKVTGAFEVEKKGKDRFIIPFSDSPKMFITCNYPLNGVDGSHRRRRIEVPIHQYFSADREPIEVYKRRFFDDFTKVEWNKFYNWMVNSIKLFLRDGLQKLEHDNLKENYLVQATDIEFLNYIKADFMPNTNSNFFIKEICEEYKEYSGYTLTGRKCSEWLKYYCDYAKKDLVKIGYRTFMFRDRD